jgi:DNA-binding transcriptional regulator YdaS (Cro superfamily)
MMTAAQKIAALGGSASAARKLGVPITTVDTWKRKDSIPAWRLPAVDAALATTQQSAA